MDGKFTKARQRGWRTKTENKNEPAPPESIQASKDRVFVIVREIVHSGNLRSAETFQPLTREEKAEYLSRSFFYFSSQDKEWQEDVQNSSTILPPVYDNILRLKRLGEPFSDALKQTVQTICQIPERDEQAFAQWVEEQREMGMPYGDDPQPEGIHQTSLNEHNLIERTIGQIKENWPGCVTGVISFENPVVRSFLSSALDEVVEVLRGAIESFNLSGVIRSYNISDHARTGLMFSAGYLLWVVGYNLFKTGRSWARCWKNTVDELGAVAIGQFAGVCLAALLAPYTGGATLYLAGAGGIAANMFTRCQIKKWTCKLLGLPEDEMLEKAYKFLGVGQLEPNDTVAKIYREKSRIHHPDKYLQRNPKATEEEKTMNLRTFLKIQAALALIVAGRDNEQEDYDKARKNFQRIEKEEALAQKKIHIRIRVAVADFVAKMTSYWLPAQCESLLTLTGGIMPYQYFEEVSAEAPSQKVEKLCR